MRKIGYKVKRNIIEFAGILIFISVGMYLISKVPQENNNNSNVLGISGEVSLLLSERTRVVVPAKFDTGASMSSIDRQLAIDYGLYKPIEGELVNIKTSNGVEKREVISVTTFINGREKVIVFNIAQREDLKTPIIIGYKDLRDFVIDPNLADNEIVYVNDTNTDVLNLLIGFSVIGTVILFTRQVLGFKTFGIFGPVLIGMSLSKIGFYNGILLYIQLIILGALVDTLLIKLRMQSLSRLVLILNVVIIYLFGLFKFKGVDISTYYYALPLVLITYLIKKFDNTIINKNKLEAVFGIVSTFGMAILTERIYSYFIENYFEVNHLIIIFALSLALSTSISFYNGIRFNEIIRFPYLLLKMGGFLGMNYRNRNIINKYNPVWAIKLVNDKVGYKKVLAKTEVPTPKTLGVISNSSEIAETMTKMETPFVIKPSNGSAGRGILIIDNKKDNLFYTPSGDTLSKKDLYAHIKRVLDGHYSLGSGGDQVLIEEKIIPSEFMKSISSISGLPDIRLIIFDTKVINAMIRIPTEKSEGKANLSKGALGAAVNVENGYIYRLFGDDITNSIKNRVLDRTVPDWENIVQMGKTAAAVSGLKYSGIDIVCTDQGPMIMEVNARPGLEIQNVTLTNLLENFGALKNSRSKILLSSN